MVCPYCSNDSTVTNSRHQKRANTVWRRRRCVSCAAVWTTIEHTERSTAYKVAHNESVSDFHPEILLISLYEALRHRKTAAADAQALALTVQHKLAQQKTAILAVESVAKTAHETLLLFDPLAGQLYYVTHPDSLAEEHHKN